ncbi:esterase 6-like [Leptidea sinapis]|uniref:esterase 6-like n=1 Tax=Leptidea sinapis TaxID=189913 RepID=UPI0021C3D310|nr:esterase 6-like [Leptidea sinapis]
MWIIVSFLFLVPLSPGVRGADELTVKLKQGYVQGYLDPDGGFYAFYGIPYATAPTGDNKFKAPLPGPVWLDVFKAVDDTIICPQKDFFNLLPKKMRIKADCLIANVFVPDTKEKNLPVVVHIHGGGFHIGYGNLNTYKHLIRSKRIIFVTFNYRLGPYGFLCLGTKDAPGNAGMKDQLALLRWVNQNIAEFGGNPEDVTIDGYSAGSSSIDLLMLSENARGLFHKAIPESGAGVAAFSVQTDPIANAIEYAKLLNYTGPGSVAELEKYYKSLPYELLVSGDVTAREDSVFLMSPCIESKENKDAFLSESPDNILKSGLYPKIPILYGFSSMEGLLRLESFDKWKQEMNDNFEAFLSPDLKFKNEDQKKKVTRKIREFYFGKTEINNDQILNFINYFTDVMFSYPTLRSVKLHVEAGHKQIYLYEFSFVYDELPIIPHTNIRGAGHCSETATVADGSPTLNYTNSRLQEMRNLTRSIWLNFITTGKPIPEDSELPPWPPVRKSWSPHMLLDLPLSLRGSLLKERTLFWDRIYKEHYQQPMPPLGSSRRKILGETNTIECK